MKQSFLNYLEQEKLCHRNDKILLAISGGLDSMAMLDLFQGCRFKVGVAHANFQLRGEGSTGDEEFVEGFCKKSSIPFYTKKFDTELYARLHQLSIQMAARELRYQWFGELAEAHHFDWIATAHHLNDSIETGLLNLVRGSGIEGFDGIESKNGKVIRPMLFATRQQLEVHAKENNITWREDRSNTSDDYQRNFIRHHVTPLLKELNPSFENSFLESMNKISGAVELESLGILWWREQFEKTAGNQIRLAKKGFDQFKRPENVLWNLIKGFGFNPDQCHQIARAVAGQSGKKFFSSEFELIIDRDYLIISKTQTRLGETLIESHQTEATLGNLKLKIDQREKIDFKDDSTTAVLDAGKIKFPLRWRKWKPGDSFYPLGMSHRKKLSDFLIDQKVSLADKEAITVLESENEIVWVVGFRVDDRYKIALATKSTVVCQLSTAD